MAPEQSVDSHEALNHIWNFWRVGGIIPFERFKSAFVPYSIFISISVTIFTSTVIIGIALEENFRVIMLNLTESVCLVCLILKHFTVFKFRKHLYNIKDILKKIDEHAICEIDRLHLKDAVKLCDRIITLYKSCFFSAGVCFVISPLITSRYLIFLAWFPFDMTIKRNYWIAYSFQSFSSLMMICQTFAVDTFPPLYVCVLCGQINALRARIRRIGKEDESKKTGIDNYKELKTCVDDHLIVIQLFKEVSILVSRTLSLQFMFTAFALCVNAVCLLFLNVDWIEMLILIMLFIAILLQVLPICYFGSKLYESTGALTDAIYNCNWIEQDIKFKKSIIIFMQGTQAEMEILAWNTVPINLPTFLRIIKFSFSIFAILGPLNKE